MTMRSIFLLSFFVFFFAAGPVWAQDSVSQDHSGRVKLAEAIHELKPTRDQVEDAINRVAEARIPAADRDAFKTAMRNILNYRAIERVSIEAMAETYTLEELEVMLDYYKKPAALSAAKKDDDYAQKVYPEIVRMLDQAMMRVRTGGN